jgi:hypothetical protein
MKQYKGVMLLVKEKFPGMSAGFLDNRECLFHIRSVTYQTTYMAEVKEILVINIMAVDER